MHCSVLCHAIACRITSPVHNPRLPFKSFCAHFRTFYAAVEPCVRKGSIQWTSRGALALK